MWSDHGAKPRSHVGERCHCPRRAGYEIEVVSRQTGGQQEESGDKDDQEGRYGLRYAIADAHIVVCGICKLIYGDGPNPIYQQVGFCKWDK